jgi:hypothetical protein
LRPVPDESGKNTVDFRFLVGGSVPGRMEFTSNPLVRYALNDAVPARSTDGGATWTSIPPDSDSVETITYSSWRCAGRRLADRKSATQQVGKRALSR